VGVPGDPSLPYFNKTGFILTKKAAKKAAKKKQSVAAVFSRHAHSSKPPRETRAAFFYSHS
jgi:hypothetical protein